MEHFSRKEQIENLKQQIYFEKLSLILQSLNQWQSKKQQEITEFYHRPMLEIQTESQTIQKEITNQAEALIQIIEEQSQFMAGLKSDKFNVKTSSSSSSGLKGINSGEKMNYLNMNPAFMVIHTQFRKKKENMIEMKVFLAKFHSVLTQEVSQSKKIYDSFDIISRELKTYVKEVDRAENEAIGSISMKKSRKFYDLKKYGVIQELYHRKVKDCSEALKKMRKAIRNMRKHRFRFLDNIMRNLEYYRMQYTLCFNEDICESLEDFYREKLKRSQHKIQENENQDSGSEMEGAELNRNIVQNLHSLFVSTLEQLSVHSWDVELKEIQKAKGKQLKKLQNLPENIEKGKKYKGHITIDKKFLCIKGLQIQREIDLDHAKVEEIINQNQAYLKIKPKKNSGVMIKFQSSEREDEFRLHVDNVQKSEMI